jgi:hypothetical protein
MCINAYSYTALQNSHVRLLLRLVSMHMVCWHGKEDPRPPLGDHLKQDYPRKATKVFHRCVEKQKKNGNIHPSESSATKLPTEGGCRRLSNLPLLAQDLRLLCPETRWSRRKKRRQFFSFFFTCISLILRISRVADSGAPTSFQPFTHRRTRGGRLGWATFYLGRKSLGPPGTANLGTTSPVTRAAGRRQLAGST